MAERGIQVDHSTVHRWAIKLLPVLEKAFRRHKRPVGRSWRVDETYIKVKGHWKCLYRAVDKAGQTVDFLLRAHRDKAAAQRYFEKSIDQNGEPETVTIDKSGANLAALEALTGRARGPQRGARHADQDPPEQVFEQHHRTGPSGYQAPYPADARVQDLSLCPHSAGRYPAHAHGCEGADERQRWLPNSRRAVLLADQIGNPNNIAICSSRHPYCDTTPAAPRDPCRDQSLATDDPGPACRSDRLCRCRSLLAVQRSHRDGDTRNENMALLL